MFGRLNFHGYNLVGHRVAQFGPEAAINGRVREVEQQVDDAGGLLVSGQKPIKQRRKFRPHARNGFNFGKKWIEQGGTHSFF